MSVEPPVPTADEAYVSLRYLVVSAGPHAPTCRARVTSIQAILEEVSRLRTENGRLEAELARMKAEVMR